MRNHRGTPPPGRKALSRFGTSAARALALVGLSLVTVAAPVRAQAAQEWNWWDELFKGPGTSSRGPAEKRPAPVELQDLRANSTPYRSDLMVDSLGKAIDQYQMIVSKGGWPLVPPGRTLRPGDSDERITALRKRLRITGDLPSRQDDYSYGYGDISFDSDVEAAVRRFQSRHGIRVSGRVDLATFAALNVPAEARLSQLKLNQNRLRELLAQRVEDRYILVNVPAFQLEAVERFEVQQRHRVIVGRTERQTPSIKATIKALNFFPYWRVPDSVAQLDLIPRLRKEPQYLGEEKIRVFASNNMQEIDPHNIDWNSASAQSIKFKQDPGPQNALGLVRIDMSNPEGVYMHDTPMKKLFDQQGRAFSAGCVRVQGVFKLAEWIAHYEVGWEQPGRVEEVLQSGQALDLNLTHPIPVYFTYITAWAEPNGRIEFRPDIYGRDGGRELLAGGEHEPGEAPPSPRSLAP